MKNNIDKFLTGQLTVTEEQDFRQAMAEDAELEFAVLQRQLELLIVEELDNRYWKGRLVEQEKIERQTDELEHLVIDELDRQYWSQQFTQWETTERQADELENLVGDELDNRYWQEQFNEWETAERLEDLVTDELDNRYWKNRLEEIETEEHKADQLEELVDQQLDDDYWRQQLKQMAAAENAANTTSDVATPTEKTEQSGLKVAHKKTQRGRVIRMISYVTAVAAMLLVGLFYLIPLLTDTGNLPDGSYDYNIKGSSRLENIQVYQMEDLPGEWTATFKELENTYMRIDLNLEPLNIFTLSATLLDSEHKSTVRPTTGRGTWTIAAGGIIRLDLDGIESNMDAGSQIEARMLSAAIKLWLKEKRLFTQPLEIVDITETVMIFSYGDGEGIQWTKKD